MPYRAAADRAGRRHWRGCLRQRRLAPSTFDRCIAEFGWREKRSLQGRLIEGRYHGLGVACFIEGGGSGPREHARMEIEADGTVVGLCGLVGDRPGHRNHHGADRRRRARPAAVRSIKVLHASTTYLREGFGSYGSRATVMGGSAVIDAANNLLEALRAARGGLVRRRAEHDILLADGACRRSPMAAPSTWASSPREPLSVEGVFRAPSPPTAMAPRRPMSRWIPHRPCRAHRLSRGRRCRPHRQSADACTAR